jgi:5'/3'-nucleotidase
MDVSRALERYVPRALRCERRQLVVAPFEAAPQVAGELVTTRASVRRYDGKIVPTTDPLGRELFWFTVSPIEGAEEGTDRWAAEQGWVSLTPLRLDRTDEAQLDAVRASRPLDEAMAAAVSHRCHPSRRPTRFAKTRLPRRSR